jgi:hypothetical protein
VDDGLGVEVSELLELRVGLALLDADAEDVAVFDVDEEGD